MTAVMKGSEGSSAMFAEYISRHTFHYCNKILDEFILIPRKLDDYPYLVQLHSCTILELCIERENVVLLKGILRSDVYHYNIQRVFETAFRLQPTEIQHALLLYDRDSTQGCRHPLYTGYRNSSFCPEAAIVCDRPDILRRYIQFMSRKKDHSIGRLLYETSIVLKRERCKGVLATYGMVDLTIIKPLSHLTQVRYLLSLLQLYKHVEHEIIVLLKTIPGVQELINTPYSYTDVKQFRYACENMTPLASYIVTAQYTENRVVTAMIQLGADIDCHDPDGQTPLLCLLKRRQITGMNRREILELLLYENVSLDERAVTYALHLDSEYGIQRQENLSGIYNTGTCEHSLFGFNSPENYAFNFAVPVLLESGSPCPEDILKDATKLTLHPSVNSYIRIYVNTPRSLQICCRNTLRKRFRGHQIYTYLEIVPCPATIKEFIALKQILE